MRYPQVRGEVAKGLTFSKALLPLSSKLVLQSVICVWTRHGGSGIFVNK